MVLESRLTQVLRRDQIQEMRKVLVCKCDLLPYSETFIRDQVLAYASWKSVLIGLRRVASGLPLDALDVRLLETSEPTYWGTIYRRVLTQLRLPHPHAVERLRREAASLAHAHFATDAVTFWPIVRRLGLPFVVTLHGYDINIYRESWENRFRSLDQRQYPRRLLSLARQPRVHFVAVSEAIKQRAIAYGVPSDRIDVHYIGVDLTRFYPSGPMVNARHPRILYVGRLVEKKGGQFLIRAYARVRSKLPEAELVMIGDGPLLGELTNLASRLNVPVQFLGSVKSDEVKRQLDMARVFCLPSVIAEDGDAEGLGISILEAQACGVPTVTSARGGATEGIVHGVTGLAVPEKEVEILSATIVRLLVDDELALSMSRAAPQFMAGRFDIRHCTQSLERLYDALVEER
jgi:glycosyltransferase involved in cell wall biosynthesis